MVLANRGWIPEAWKQRKVDSTTESPLNGLVVENEKPNFFVPKNEPQNGNWFFVDSVEIVSPLQMHHETLLIGATLWITKWDPHGPQSEGSRS